MPRKQQMPLNWHWKPFLNPFVCVCVCVCMRACMQDVITGDSMRNTASGLLIVAPNKTELNGDGRLQLTHAQKKSLTAELTLDFYALTSAGIQRNLKWFRHRSWTWQPCIHWGTNTHTKMKRSQNQGSTYISFLWTGEANMTSLPPCPLWREREGEKLRSTKEITEEQFSIQACSVAPMHDGAAPLWQSETMFKI